MATSNLGVNTSSVLSVSRFTQASSALAGTGGADRFSGGSGSDTFDGGAGNDVLYGGGGADLLQGGNGTDTAYGGSGDDRLEGGDDTDALYGGGGNDLLIGDAFFDLDPDGDLDVGNDRLYGGAGNDVARGGLGDDKIYGGSGADDLVGDGGNDSLYGGRDSDRLDGRHGDDRLDGGSGNDLLTDGAGADTFIGGDGADTFVYLRTEDLGRDDGGPVFPGYGVGDDTILDFDLEERDVLEFSLYEDRITVTDVDDDGQDTVFTISDGETLTLRGFSGEDFEPGLRFDSEADINALSQALFGYDAIIPWP